MENKKPKKVDLKFFWINKMRYDWYQVRRSGSIVERVYLNLKNRFILDKLNYKNNLILDLGCGTGVFTFDVASVEAKVVGCDISIWALKKAKKRPENKKYNLNFLVADCDFLPFKENAFDIIINTGLIHYYEHPENMIEEMNRILKPDGKILLEAPWKYSPYNLRFFRFLLIDRKKDYIEPVKRSFTVNEIKKYFEEFKIKNCFNNFLFIYFIFVKK